MDESTTRARHPDSMRQAFLWALLPTLALLLIAPAVGDAQQVVTTNITPSALPSCPGPCGVGVTIVTAPPTGGTVTTITGGARPGGGPNLFHSFGRFDVGTGDIANFFNETGLPTSNILSRVTGGNPSQIYGTIQTTDFPGANLFLMNPAGVLFGATAVLDLGAVTGSAVRQPGSFYATTADYLNLGDAAGTSPFYADPAQTSVLSVAPVVAFGFLGPNAASIAIQGGNLEVSEGQTLSFIGGPGVFTPDTGVTVPSGVTMAAGRLSAPNGLIYMETVTAAGEIPLPTLSGNPLGSPVSFPGSENAVIYIQSGELVMKGASLLTATTGPTSGEPIGINVEVAGRFTMQNGSTLSSSTTGEDQAGAINVSASTLAMDASSITTETSGDGNAGHITANVGTLSLDIGAAINSNNFSVGSGQGGNVTIQGLQGAGSAADSVTLTNSASITTQTFGSGRGGEILITSRAVQLDTGAGINSFTFNDFEAGAGGNISLNISTLSLMGSAMIQSLSGTNSPGFGKGGNVTIQGLPGAAAGAAKLVGLSGGSSLSTQTFGSGDGGLMTITSESVAMDGGATINASTFGTGRGGDIMLSVQQASLSGSSTITSSTVVFGSAAAAGGTITVQGLPEPGKLVTKADSLSLSQGSHINSEAFGEGRLGDIVVRAKTVNLTDEAAIQAGSDRDPGTAGSVTIDADSVSISSASRISSQAFADDAGQVDIKANQLTLDNGSLETSTHGIGRAGNVVLDVVGNISLSNGARINSSSLLTDPGAGDAGTITITTIGNRVSLASGSSITSSTVGPGNAGRVIVTTPTLNVDNANITTSTSGTGNAGSITANVDTLTLTNAAEIASSSTGAATGAAGSVTIQGLASPADAVTVTNSSLRTSADSTGRGGSITVDATNLTLNNATISAAVTDVPVGGDAAAGVGNIALIAPTLQMTGGSISAATTGSRNAGNIALLATTFSADSGATITSSSTGAILNAGDAGQIVIATPTLSLNDAVITTSTSGIGSAGSITAIVGTIALTNGAEISSSSTGTATGNAGSITIQGLVSPADSVTITDSSLLTTAANTGQGGSISVNATNLTLKNATISASVKDLNVADPNDGAAVGTGNIGLSAHTMAMTDNSKVTTESSGSRNAGDILINSPDVPGNTFEMWHSTMSTSAALADGGNIGIYATNMVRLTDSIITSSVGNETEIDTLGGNIKIDPQFVILQNSQIRANAFAGSGGAIDIISGVYPFLDPSSQIDASSTRGISGTVTISAPGENVGGQLTPMSQQFSSAAALLAQRCAARVADGKFSTFVVAGREGLPVEPGGFLASPSLTAELLGSSLSGRDRHTQFPAVTGAFQDYDAKPIQLAKYGDACHQ